MRPHSKVLQEMAPHAQFRSQVSVSVRASPNTALASFEQVTPRDMPLATLLGNLRYLPGRLMGKKPPRAASDLPFSQQLQTMGTQEVYRDSFEIVTGSAGKYHQLSDQEFVKFQSKEELMRFNHPDFQKLFISVRAEEVSPGRCRLVLEHWTEALSPKLQRQFGRYWLIIRPMGNFVSRILLKAAARRAEIMQRNRDRMSERVRFRDTTPIV